MSVFKRRTRIVSFRLSEEEFQRVTDLCEIAGARSISDLARNAVQEFLSHAPGNPPPDKS